MLGNQVFRKSDDLFIVKTEGLSFLGIQPPNLVAHEWLHMSLETRQSNFQNFYHIVKYLKEILNVAKLSHPTTLTFQLMANYW